MPRGDYERLDRACATAWRQMRQSVWDSQEHETHTRRHAELTARRAAYLRDLLNHLPFRWHIEHAYTPHETASYGGADHIVVDEPVRIGRLRRDPGDALSRRRPRFWGLSRVEEDRLPTALADIRVAEQIVANL